MKWAGNASQFSGPRHLHGGVHDYCSSLLIFYFVSCCFLDCRPADRQGVRHHADHYHSDCRCSLNCSHGDDDGAADGSSSTHCCGCGSRLHGRSRSARDGGGRRGAGCGGHDGGDGGVHRGDRLGHRGDGARGGSCAIDSPRAKSTGASGWLGGGLGRPCQQPSWRGC